jgi:hypothetical protein
MAGEFDDDDRSGQELLDAGLVARNIHTEGRLYFFNARKAQGFVERPLLGF